MSTNLPDEPPTAIDRAAAARPTYESVRFRSPNAPPEFWSSLPPYGETKLDPTQRYVDAVSVLGVGVTDLTFTNALETLDQALAATDGVHRPVYFANAHTLNCAFAIRGYRDVLNAAWRVLGDGTGVRWAARLQGMRLKANLNGTDIVPAFLERNAARGASLYLLGGEESVNADAIATIRLRYPGWNIVGRHHGFVQSEADARPVVDEIQLLRPDVLIVAMGNPLQEQWIERYRDQLPVKLSFGVGGLVDYIAGRNQRAPAWIRKLGHEWLAILARQPHKWKRYLLGNPLFLVWMAAYFFADRRRTQTWNTTGL